MNRVFFYVLAIAALWHFGGWHFKQQPTQDQLYGCTVQQQAPNGDCP